MFRSEEALQQLGGDDGNKTEHLLQSVLVSYCACADHCKSTSL